MNKISYQFLLLLFFLSSCSKTNKITPKNLHVPSPEWQDQIMYFIMIDRFNDGDASNNDFHMGEYNPTSNNHFNGGDIQGIIDKIDYLKKLGITSLWITPPVANQWFNPDSAIAGYHGYWAENFKKVDKHFGDLKDYQQLSATLHQNGMYLIQDIVVNHTGDYIRYEGNYNPKNLKENFVLHTNTPPVAGPTQAPFHHNDVTNFEDSILGIYNFTPSIADFRDPNQKLTYQMSNLDDLNTRNPLVREVLKNSYNHWIEKVGVDGFRFDTPVYVEHDFWHDFIHSTDSKALGVERFAKTLGKDAFFTFGETWVRTEALNDAGDREVAGYLGTIQKPEMTSGLNFPLNTSMRRVFAEGQPTYFLEYRLNSLNRLFKRPDLLCNFIDNHDMSRFLETASYESFQQAMLFMMTIPGIPIIYYGTEQGFKKNRKAMFKGGFDSPDTDFFNTKSQYFQFVQKLIALRKNNRIFSRGKLEVLKSSKLGAGILAYRLTHENETFIVLLNTANDALLVDNLTTRLDGGQVLETIYSFDDAANQFIINANGRLNIELPAKAGMVCKVTDKTIPVSALKQTLTLMLENPNPKSETLMVAGAVSSLKTVQLVLDGILSTQQVVQVEQNSWKASVPIHYLSPGQHQLTAYAKTDKGQIQLATQVFDFQPTPILVGHYDDALSDDKGPKGTYLYPTDKTFGKQMDISDVAVYRLGTNLQIDITMADAISTIWNPNYGFDHVHFGIYIDLSSKTGVRSLPHRNANMPNDAKWDYAISLGGWATSIMNSEGATANQAGTPANITPAISVDKNKQLIRCVIPSVALGKLPTTKGVKIYIVTWDEEGENGFRTLATEPKLFVFGGGKKGDPLIMDDTALIELEE